MVFETGSHYAAQAGLELRILPPPACRDYRRALPCLAAKDILKGTNKQPNGEVRGRGLGLLSTEREAVLQQACPHTAVRKPSALTFGFWGGSAD
jgi:hypothetical protein